MSFDLEEVVDLSQFDGKEVSPGVFLIGEPSVVNGELRSLANVFGALAVVVLKITPKVIDQ
jgi:hypothetical protein